MSIFDDINRIEFSEILSKLWIQFVKNWHSLELYEDWKYTDGWRWDELKGFIKDFAGKRAEWDRITFIMNHLWMAKWEVVDWYVERFGLVDPKAEFKWWAQTQISDKELIWILANQGQKQVEVAEEKMSLVRVYERWNSFWPLTEQQREYLKSRMIDPDKVDKYCKNNNWFITVAIFNESGKIISFQWRSASHEDKSYRIEKWTNSKWCFVSDINKDLRKIYIVEWMSDFLTLSQFTTNVVWMKSALDWANVVREFANRWYELIFIPDNDEAGKNMMKQFDDIKYSMMDLDVFSVKDFNELICATHWEQEDVLDNIEEFRTKEPSNIDLAFEKFYGMQKIYTSRGWMLGYKTPFKALDNVIQGIIEGKVYSIWAYANTGKSQFSYEFVQDMLKKWKRVWYFSLEVDAGMLLSHVAKALYKENYKHILSWEVKVNKKDFANLFIYDNIRKFDQIKKTCELEKFDAVFIDYFQAISYPGQWYEKYDNLAMDIQAMAIETNTSVFILSQVTNESRNQKEWNMITLKWGGWLQAASDVVMTLANDTWFLKLSISKNKFWKREDYIVSNDFENGTWKLLAEDSRNSNSP